MSHPGDGTLGEWQERLTGPGDACWHRVILEPAGGVGSELRRGSMGADKALLDPLHGELVTLAPPGRSLSTAPAQVGSESGSVVLGSMPVNAF